MHDACMSTHVRMRASLRRLQRACAVVIAALAALNGCDAFAEPSEEQDGDQRTPGGGIGGIGGVAGIGPIPPRAGSPSPPVQGPPVVPPCPVAIPTVGSACSSSQLCMYTEQTPCMVVSVARCTASVWTVTDIPLGQCPGEPDDDAGIDDEDAGWDEGG
jgi:hypothetical protein